jgi:hypothetical protein
MSRYPVVGIDRLIHTHTHTHAYTYIYIYMFTANHIHPFIYTSAVRVCCDDTPEHPTRSAEIVDLTRWDEQTGVSLSTFRSYTGTQHSTGQKAAEGEEGEIKKKRDKREPRVHRASRRLPGLYVHCDAEDYYYYT